MNFLDPKMAKRVLEGDVRAASRLMRDIDDGVPSATADLQTLFPKTGRAYVIGITGAPGAGKSTLTDRLITEYRSEGKSLGIIAVDPTSPFTGGAILGDRIRMQDHATDPGVFIRSLATRGNLGGLSRATGDCIRVMDAMGKDLILVETVGVGQDEVDIARMAHTTVVMLVPGMGDDVQAIKAGILEVADVFAVNKADLDGADRIVRELMGMLELRHAVKPSDASGHHGPGSLDQPAGPVKKSMNSEWEPPILKVIASKGQGVKELCGAIAKHRDHLVATGQIRQREEERAKAQFVALLKERLLGNALHKLEREKGRLEEVAARIAQRKADPYALADELAARLLTD
jgi:LAO/AO transport system kinase